MPQRKPSKRAKYGRPGAADEEGKKARVPAPPIVRPRPKSTTQFFDEIIRSAELGARTGTAAPTMKGQEESTETAGQDLLPGATAEAGGDESNDDRENAAALRERVTSSSHASTPQPAPTPGAATAPPYPAGPRRHRKLFPDSLEGPYPSTTGRIVARIAACRHWRRPLAHRLLRRYLLLFDEHAAAYFFRHVPSLQPGGPGGGGRSGSGPHPESAGFRRMVVAVCCHLLPQLPAFGPRALACMAAGLGAMRIRHALTLSAWESASVGVLGAMRPHQLTAALEGLAALRPGAGAAGARPPLARTWREAALGAVAAALPRCSAAEVGRLLQALAALQLAPPPGLLDAACARVVRCVGEEAARLRGRKEGAAAEGASEDGGEDDTHGASLLLLAAAQAEAALAAGAEAAPPTEPQRPDGGAPVIGVAAAAAAAAATAGGTTTAGAAVASGARGRAGRRRGRPAPSPPEPEPLRGGDLACVLAGLGALAPCGQPPPASWLGWLEGGTGAVLAAQLAGRRQGGERRSATARRWVAAGGAGEGAPAGTEGRDAGAADAAAVEALAAVPFFQLEDLAMLAEGAAALADQMPAMTSGAVHDDRETINGAAGGGHDQAAAPAAPAAPLPLSRSWLDLLCEAALADMRARLDPATATAAAAAAAAAAPTAFLTQGDVTRANAEAAAAVAGAAAAAEAAATAAAPAVSTLLAALARLQPRYTPPAGWRAALADLGLELLPRMSPGALLLWLRCFAAWAAPPSRPAAAGADTAAAAPALSPSWLAAVAVSSRANLAAYSSADLCALPAALRAAGAGMPAAWAAHYLRHLASRLPPPPPTQPEPHDGSKAGRVTKLGRRRRGRQSGPVAGSSGDVGGGDDSLEPGLGASGGAPAAACEQVALRDAAAALGWLPALVPVPGLRYVGECEGRALQTVAEAFGLTAQPPPPPPHGEPDAPWAAREAGGRAADPAGGPQAQPAAGAGVSAPGSPSPLGTRVTSGPGGGGVAASAAVRGGPSGVAGEEVAQVVAFFAAAGWRAEVATTPGSEPALAGGAGGRRRGARGAGTRVRRTGHASGRRRVGLRGRKS